MWNQHLTSGPQTGLKLSFVICKISGDWPQRSYCPGCGPGPLRFLQSFPIILNLYLILVLVTRKLDLIKENKSQKCDSATTELFTLPGGKVRNCLGPATATHLFCSLDITHIELCYYSNSNKPWNKFPRSSSFITISVPANLPLKPPAEATDVFLLHRLTR